MVVPPFHTSKWSYLVGKPMVAGYHHFRKPPYPKCFEMFWASLAPWGETQCCGMLHCNRHIGCDASFSRSFGQMEFCRTNVGYRSLEWVKLPIASRIVNRCWYIATRWFWIDVLTWTFDVFLNWVAGLQTFWRHPPNRKHSLNTLSV